MRKLSWTTTGLGGSIDGTGGDVLSPGRPPVRRDPERAFWGADRAWAHERGRGGRVRRVESGGITVVPHAGGMPPIQLAPVSGTSLSFSEREDIAVLRAEGISMRQIAIRIGRSPSTISRELRRNAATRNGKLDYRASTAQWKADLAARRPKAAKLVEHPHLRGDVQDKLSEFCETRTETWWARSCRGKAATSRGEPIAGGQPLGVRSRSSNRLPIDFPDDESMRISHEAIYQSLYIEGRGALERELAAMLAHREGAAQAASPARRKCGTGFITDEVTIGASPLGSSEVDDPGPPPGTGG